jgi:hypothetical protein
VLAKEGKANSASLLAAAAKLYRLRAAVGLSVLQLQRFNAAIFAAPHLRAKLDISTVTLRPTNPHRISRRVAQACIGPWGCAGPATSQGGGRSSYGLHLTQTAKLTGVHTSCVARIYPNPQNSVSQLTSTELPRPVSWSRVWHEPRVRASDSSLSHGPGDQWRALTGRPPGHSTLSQ